MFHHSSISQRYFNSNRIVYYPPTIPNHIPIRRSKAKSRVEKMGQGRIRWKRLALFISVLLVKSNELPLSSNSYNESESDQTIEINYRFRARQIRVVRSIKEVSQKPKQIPFFTEEEFRTEVIVPVMNIMGLGLSVFGNMYPMRQLRNDDGTPMNVSEVRSFRSNMNVFHTKFNELGQSLTGVVQHSRALKNPFNMLGKKITNGRQLRMETEQKLKTEKIQLLDRLKEFFG